MLGNLCDNFLAVSLRGLNRYFISHLHITDQGARFAIEAHVNLSARERPFSGIRSLDLS